MSVNFRKTVHIHTEGVSGYLPLTETPQVVISDFYESDKGRFLKEYNVDVRAELFDDVNQAGLFVNILAVFTDEKVLMLYKMNFGKI